MTPHKIFHTRNLLKTKEKVHCLTRIRILSGDQIALGPGKVSLLEEIDRSGSISKAAQKLGLSYRRAWTLVDTMNKNFKSYLVTSTAGGGKGGGTYLTPLGSKMVRTYRAMERKAERGLQEN